MTGSITARYGGNAMGAPDVDAHLYIPETTGTLNAVDGPKGVSDQYAHEDKLIVLSSGQANAEMCEDHAPALTCLHEAPVLAMSGTSLQSEEDRAGTLTTAEARGNRGVMVFDTTQITHPDNRSNPQPGDPSPSLSSGAHPPTIAFAQNQREEVREMNVAGTVDAERGTHQQTFVAFSCKDHGADVGETAPTVRSVAEGGSHANGGGQIAVAFKASHFTRGKDGAPGELAPPLSADADKGDQDTLIAAPAVAMVDLQAGAGLAQTQEDGASFTLAAKGEAHAVAFHTAGYGASVDAEKSATLQASDARLSNQVSGVIQAMQVRRLTPRECERLQGFRDDYTLITVRGKPAADGPRYRALGNSMAVPVMRWIGERIAFVDAVKTPDEATRTAKWPDLSLKVGT